MSDPYVGEIRMFAGNFAPQDWQFCDGSLLSISQYDTLFTLIGTNYGGDGQNTFGVPDLRGRLPVHAGSGYTLAQSGGQENVTLTTGQLPTHTHFFAASTGAPTTASPSNAVLGSSASVALYTAGAPVATMSPLAPAGGNTSHGNMMPYLAVNFIISLFGIFPSQS